MRVALLLEQALAPVPGGTGRYAVELARELSRLPEVEITAWTAWHRDRSRAALPRVRGPRGLPLPRRALTLAWERGLGPVPRDTDLVHAPTLLLPPRRRRPLVVTIHDAVPWTHPETLTPRGVRWHRAMAQRAVATADAVVVPSAATAAALARYLPLRSEPEVIPLGGGGLAVPGDAEERRARLGLPLDGYVLALGTVEPRKGVDRLVRAMARPGSPEFPLVLVGPAGWGAVDPRGLAAASGLAPERLRVLGRLGDEDLAAVVMGAAVLAVPSRAEGFGLPALEGMALGTPVVTSRDPALLEVGGDAVRAVDAEDADALAAALAEACRDGGTRATMVARGRARAEAFSWRATAERTLALYRRLG